MFEKEAEEWVIDNVCKDCSRYEKCKSKEHCTCKECTKEKWQKGAEFGYNKAKENADKMKSQFLELCNLKDMRIAELEKANEWHYVKDGIFPTHSNGVLVFTDEGVGLGIYGLDNKKWYTYDTGFEVIAWKEIVFPKELKFLISELPTL